MDVHNLSNFHYGYAHLVRHWHAESESFAGGDALFTAVENGWDISETVRFDEHWNSGAQCVVVYHFEMARGDERMTMPVITNPFVQRMLKEMDAKLVTGAEKKTVKTVK